MMTMDNRPLPRWYDKMAWYLVYMTTTAFYAKEGAYYGKPQ